MNPQALQLVVQLRRARRRTLALVDDLDEDQLRDQRAPRVEAPLWHLGHVAWFQEFWTVRRTASKVPKIAAVDALYDPRRVPPGARAELDLPPHADTRRYLEHVLDAVTLHLERDELDTKSAWFHGLTVAHEDLHGEALVQTRQALGLAAPIAGGDLYALVSDAMRSGRSAATERGLRLFEARIADELAKDGRGSRPIVRMELATGRIRVRRDGVDVPVDMQLLSDLAARILHAEMLEHLAAPDRAAIAEEALAAGPCRGDVELPGGAFALGARGDEAFTFDNERGAQAVELAPIRMARAPVTQAEFAEFVDARGYEREACWSEVGLRWRDANLVRGPMHWEKGHGGRWFRRHFDALLPIEEHRPMTNVNAFEAEAWCRWAGRRLPSEAEWEYAASANADGTKRRFPWGDDPVTPRRAHLDLASPCTVDVNAHASGDTPSGLRQMLGNAWEWTSSPLTRYTGFRPDVLAHYSERGFDRHRVLRGGSFATSTSLARNTFRHFLPPEERNAFAGFRTCAV
ncbi:MAG: ergothioneine biosynthesis protein EgtB [Planctomycetes bacterium]|nr:ergothioneine biosynthesis protein EgtB [Planctomycetota bacterium]